MRPLAHTVSEFELISVSAVDLIVQAAANRVLAFASLYSVHCIDLAVARWLVCS